MAEWQRIHLPMQEVQEIRVQSLGWEDLLEKGVATHSSILAWRIPWTEEPSRLLCPLGFPDKNTGVGCYSLLQGIFLTQGENTHLLHLLYWQVDSLLSELPGKPKKG